MSPKDKKYLEREIQKAIRDGLSKDDIVTKVLSKDPYDTMPTIQKDEVIDHTIKFVDADINYELIQKVANGKIVRLLNEKGREVLYSPANNRAEPTNLNTIRDVMQKHVWENSLAAALSDYDPHTKNRFFRRDGSTYFNVYNAPFWKPDIESQPPVTEIPELYSKFIMALVDQDKPSFDFIIKWLANSIRGRNLTCLCTIGNKGIGKQLFGDLIAALHGEDNFRHVRGGSIDQKFNGFLKNKTAVYLDECKIKTDSQEEAFKMLVNSRLEVELKGQDSMTVNSFVNYYISSNTMSAMRISPDERRFSIVNVRSAKLLREPGFEDPKAYSLQMCEPNNLRQFANYLWNYQYNPTDKDLLEGFKSQRFNEVFNAGFTRWQSHFINVYCRENAGKTIKYQDVNRALAMATDTKVNPAVTTWKEFYKRIKSRWDETDKKQTFRVYQNQKPGEPHHTLVDISKLEDQSETLIEDTDSE